MIGLLKVIWKEIKRIVSEPTTLLPMFFAPLVFTILFGYIYVNRSVFHVSTAVIDKDNTSLSREIIDGFESSDKFDIKYYLDDENLMKEYFDEGKVDAFIVIPHGLMKDLLNRKATNVLVAINGSNMIISNTVLSAATEIVQTYSYGTTLKYLEMGGQDPEMAQNIMMPISLKTRIWYNPTYNYLVFLVTGLIGVVIQQICFLYTSNSFLVNGRTLVEQRLSLINVIQKIAGILIIHFVINFLNFILCVNVFINLFDVPMRGSYMSLYLLGGAFVLSVLPLGIFLSIVCKNELQSTQIAMFFAVPSFLLSGFTWPYLMLPEPLKIVADMLPISYFVNPMRKIILMGTDISYLKHEYIVLLAIAAVALPVAVLAYIVKTACIRKFSKATEVNIQ